MNPSLQLIAFVQPLYAEQLTLQAAGTRLSRETHDKGVHLAESFI
jgi:hypothetical protein